MNILKHTPIKVARIVTDKNVEYYIFMSIEIDEILVKEGENIKQDSWELRLADANERFTDEKANITPYRKRLTYFSMGDVKTLIRNIEKDEVKIEEVYFMEKASLVIENIIMDNNLVRELSIPNGVETVCIDNDENNPITVHCQGQFGRLVCYNTVQLNGIDLDDPNGPLSLYFMDPEMEN